MPLWIEFTEKIHRIHDGHVYFEGDSFELPSERKQELLNIWHEYGNKKSV